MLRCIMKVQNEPRRAQWNPPGLRELFRLTGGGAIHHNVEKGNFLLFLVLKCILLNVKAQLHEWLLQQNNMGFKASVCSWIPQHTTSTSSINAGGQFEEEKKHQMYTVILLYLTRALIQYYQVIVCFIFGVIKSASGKDAASSSVT